MPGTYEYFWVTKGGVSQKDISNFRARECLSSSRSHHLGRSLTFTSFAGLASSCTLEHPASSHDLWIWLLVAWFKWISKPLGHITGQEETTSFTHLFFCLSTMLWAMKGWMALRLQRHRGGWVDFGWSLQRQMQRLPWEHPRGKHTLSSLPIRGTSVSPSHRELLETCIHRLPARIPSEVTYLQLHMPFWVTFIGLPKLDYGIAVLHFIITWNYTSILNGQVL